MTKKEISDYINGLIQRAKVETAKEDNEKDLNEIMFEFYSTVASYYDGKMPESIHNEFLKSTPEFNDYLDKKMAGYRKESRNAKSEVESLEKEVDKALKRLSVLKEGQIKVVADKSGKNAPDTDSLKSLLEMMNSGEDGKTPEQVDEAYLYLYKIHSTGNKISKSIHNMIMQYHPQLAETLRVFNSEEEKEKLEDSINNLNFSLIEAKMEKDKKEARIIEVYDDSPRSYSSNNDYEWRGFGRC